ncbi:MAG: carboxy terminal-processing peptidase, partial [Sphingobacteriales bacterium]
ITQLEKINDKVFSLNLDKYRAEQKEIKAIIKKIDEVNKPSSEMSLSLIPVDEKRLAQDADQLERRKLWAKSLGKDIYLKETVAIIKSLINQASFVKQ